MAKLKCYCVTKCYSGYCDFHNIWAKDEEEAIELAQKMEEDGDWVNCDQKDMWFAERNDEYEEEIEE